MKNILLILLLVVSCDNTPCSATERKNRVVERLGVFQISKDLSIKIGSSSKETLSLAIFEDGLSTYQEQTGASNSQRWFFCWDEPKRTLWFWSSDIGGCKWIKSKAGTWHKHFISNLDLPDMPKEFVDHLPKSLMEEWRISKG